jgi:hypothetical protein
MPRIADYSIITDDRFTLKTGCRPERGWNLVWRGLR